MFGHYRPASETPFKWRFVGGPMMSRLKCYLDPLSSNPKKYVRVGPPPLRLSESAHEKCHQFIDSYSIL